MKPENQLYDIFNYTIEEYEKISDEKSDTTIDRLLESIQKQLDEYYKTHKRHEYYQIASYMYAIQGGDRINNGKFDILSYVFRELYEKCKNDKVGNNVAYKENCVKLCDHILMEINRVGYFANISDIEEIKNIMNELQKEEKKLKKELAKNMKANSDIIENTKHTIEKQYKDYIAILGIFAAIFMAFDSGLKIELEILNRVNDYAKGVLIIFIALFTYILLKSFYKFIVNIYIDKVPEKTTKITQEQIILFIMLVFLAGLYCYLIYKIDKQYERKIEPIVKEEISKLQQKEEKGSIIIYNNTSSTQNQDSTIIPKDEHIQQPMKIKANPPKQNTKKQSDNIKQACPPCQN